MTYLEAKSQPGGTDTGVDRTLVQLRLSSLTWLGIEAHSQLMTVSLGKYTLHSKEVTRKEISQMFVSWTAFCS